jgi:hypothetical protein
MTAIAAVPAINIQPSAQYTASRKSAFIVASQTAMEEQVCDLIEAAGPLAIEHIAGGLSVPVSEAQSCIGHMVERGWLKQDEFARYRLWGPRAR